jgi:hypothetical protein
MMKYDPKGISDFSCSYRSKLQADRGSQAACAVYRGQDQIDVFFRAKINPSFDPRYLSFLDRSLSLASHRICILCTHIIRMGGILAN